MSKQTLINPRDIRRWVDARHGQPALRRGGDVTGSVPPRLALNFAHRRAPDRMETIDDGVSPVSWTAWLAELERQKLALKVDAGSDEGDYELVPRSELN